MSVRSRMLGSLVLLCFSGATAIHAWSQAVTTYHYDNHRTGWDSKESKSHSNERSSSYFGLLRTVALDDPVDSQPLYMPAINITSGQFQGTHQVVYVATESNSIYAIDAGGGAVLLKANFGPPVPKPLGCKNNGPNVGITSTPVIDKATNTLYVMVYTLQSTGPAYLLHALDLGNLSDKVAPRLVTASPDTERRLHVSFQREISAAASRVVVGQFGCVRGFW